MTSTNFAFFGFPIVLLLSVASVGKAQLILGYDFSGSSVAPTCFASNVTTTSNFNYNGSASTFFTDASDHASNAVLPPSGDPQLGAGGWSTDSTDSAYYSFTVGSTSGLTIDELSFWAWAANATNDLDYRVDLSIGGGTFQTIGSGNIPPSNVNTAYLKQEIPLSISNETSNLEFRIFGLNYTPLSSFRVDDIRLTAVPEPSAFLFLSLVALTALGTTRLRRGIIGDVLPK